jgi:hypothetical protein
MLQSKISDLGTPSEEQGRQGQHGRYIAHTDISNVDTPGGKYKYITQGLLGTNRRAMYLLAVSQKKNCFYARN